MEPESLPENTPPSSADSPVIILIHPNHLCVRNSFAVSVNFIVRQDLVLLISMMDGIEYAHIISRYSFCITIGLAFVTEEVQNAVREKILHYVAL